MDFKKEEIGELLYLVDEKLGELNKVINENEHKTNKGLLFRMKLRLELLENIKGKLEEEIAHL